jgi:hypothetical protein
MDKAFFDTEEIENNFYISGYTLGHISDIDEEAIEELRLGGVKAYDGYNFIDAFEENDFESIFYMSYELIKDLDLNDLRIICRDFIEKIFDIYNYQIIPTPVFKNFEDVDEFLDFIKFLKFDNVSFLFDLFTDMSIDIKKIVELNTIKDLKNINIINHIENISFKFKTNSYIYQYLISQSRLELLRWLDEIFIRNKSDILLELISN